MVEEVARHALAEELGREQGGPYAPQACERWLPPMGLGLRKQRTPMLGAAFEICVSPALFPCYMFIIFGDSRAAAM